ncbi:hypothetical protein AB0M39_38515 [Streptomyces sp. NPDC051907]|uniref:hypothetical protein n=1 Tax=Streptomyces sp. NPDC051907 TaxID=3155284 RepID=UPI00343D7F51
MFNPYGVHVLEVQAEQRRARLRILLETADGDASDGESDGESGGESGEDTGAECPDRAAGLPDDPSFFFDLLWESADARRGSPLTDVVTPQEIRDPAWAQAHAHRFVERVVRRGTPERAGRGAARGTVHVDYDLWVTDARWLNSLTPGGCRRTGAVAGHADRRGPDDPSLPDLRRPVAGLRPFGGAEYVFAIGMAFSDDGRYFACTDIDGETVVYDAHDWSVRARPASRPWHDTPRPMWVPGAHVLTLHDGAAPSSQWAYDVDALAEVQAPCQSGRARSLSGRHRVEYGRDDCVTFVAGPGEGSDREVRIGEHPAPGLEFTVESAAFTADETRLYVGNHTDVFVLDPAAGRGAESVALAAPPVTRVKGVAVSPDGAYLALACTAQADAALGDEIRLIRLADGEVLVRYRPEAVARGLLWSPDGSLLAAHLVAKRPGASEPGGDRPPLQLTPEALTDDEGGEIRVFQVGLTPESLEAPYVQAAAGEDRSTAGPAAFGLGRLRQERGESAGAAEAYRRAYDIGCDEIRAKAMLYLGDLHAAQNDVARAVEAYELAAASAEDPYGPRAALRLGVLLQSAGRAGEAQEAYARALSTADPETTREARRLAGTETTAERAFRLARDGDRDAARRTTARDYGSAAVAVFALALLDGERAAAAELLGQLARPDASSAARLCLDLAGVHRRESRPQAAEAMLELAVASGAAVSAYRDAHDDGAAGGSADAVGESLLRLLADRGCLREIAAVAELAAPARPAVASLGFRLLAEEALDRQDLAAAADWFQRCAAVPDPRQAPKALWNLGLVRQKLGELTAAQEAFARAEEAESARAGHAAAARAARRLAELADDRGDRAAAVAAWARAAYRTCLDEIPDDDAEAAWSVVALGDLLAETGDAVAACAAYELIGRTAELGAAGVADLRRQRLLATYDPAAAHELLLRMAADARHLFRDRARFLLGAVPHEEYGDLERAVCEHRGARTDTDSWAPFHYARLIGRKGHQEQARRLLRRVAETSGEGAAEAAVALGFEAREEGDEAEARRQWLRAAKAGYAKTAHSAAMSLGALAKEARDMPGTLRWLEPIADSGHDEAPLAAAHIAELSYWTGQSELAVRWYRRALGGTDDPELVGEAAYRMAEIAHERGEDASARELLRRAVEAGDPSFAKQATALLAEL